MWRILAFTLAHFVAWLASALITFGTDMDQLRGRSALSRTIGHVYDVLNFPHDTLLRMVPNRHIAAMTVPAIITTSLLWGLALYAFWSLARRRRSRTARTQPT